MPEKPPDTQSAPYSLQLSREMTPRQVSVFSLALRQLVTKSFLVSQGRTADLEDYVQTGNETYEQQTGLQLCEMEYVPKEATMPAGSTLRFMINGDIDEDTAAVIRQVIEGTPSV